MTQSTRDYLEAGPGRVTCMATAIAAITDRPPLKADSGPPTPEPQTCKGYARTEATPLKARTTAVARSRPDPPPGGARR